MVGYCISGVETSRDLVSHCEMLAKNISFLPTLSNTVDMHSIIVDGDKQNTKAGTGIVVEEQS